jgi:hypothetical protein
MSCPDASFNDPSNNTQSTTYETTIPETRQLIVQTPSSSSSSSSQDRNMTFSSGHDNNDKDNSMINRRDEIAKRRRLKKMQQQQLLEQKRQRRFQQLQQQHGWSDVSSWTTFQETFRRRCQQQPQQQQQSMLSTDELEEQVTKRLSLGLQQEQMQHDDDIAPPPSKAINVVEVDQGRLLQEFKSSDHQGENNVLRIAVIGCGGWFANRAHLPALAKLIRSSSSSSSVPTTTAEKDGHITSIKRYQITVLCGSHPERAIRTLARHGVPLVTTTRQQQRDDDNTHNNNVKEEKDITKLVCAFPTLDAYLDYEEQQCFSQTIRSTQNASTHHPSCRDYTLADVCLLCLPTPRMVQAIGRCLRANKVRYKNVKFIPLYQPSNIFLSRLPCVSHVRLLSSIFCRKSQHLPRRWHLNPCGRPIVSWNMNMVRIRTKWWTAAAPPLRLVMLAVVKSGSWQKIGPTSLPCEPFVSYWIRTEYFMVVHPLPITCSFDNNTNNHIKVTSTITVDCRGDKRQRLPNNYAM